MIIINISTYILDYYMDQKPNVKKKRNQKAPKKKEEGLRLKWLIFIKSKYII